MTHEQLRPSAVKLYNLYFKDSTIYARAFTDGSGYEPVEQAPTVEDVVIHLNGGLPIGDYTVRKGDLVHYFGWDVDCEEDIWKARAWSAAISSFLTNLHIAHSVFFSGNKGYHIIVFLSDPMPASAARNFAMGVCKSLNIPMTKRKDNVFKKSDGKVVVHKVECYPKQDALQGEKIGNLIKLPGCKHPKTGRRACMVDARSGAWESSPLSFEATEIKQLTPSYVLSKIAYVERPILQLVELLLPVWVKGERHNLGLDLVGWLIKSGWEREEIETLASELASQSGSDEKAFYERIKSTYKKYESDGADSVEGWTGVENSIGDDKDLLGKLSALVGQGATATAETITLDKILERVAEIKIGVEKTELGRRIGQLSAEARKAVGKALKATGMELHTANALINSCHAAVVRAHAVKLAAGRPIIEMAERTLDELRDDAIRALTLVNEKNPSYPVVYVSSGTLFRTRTTEAGEVMQEMSEDMLRSALCDAALWTYAGRPAIIKRDIAEAVLSKGEWDFPPLTKVVSYPTFTPQGVLCTQTGYNPESGMFYTGEIVLGDTSPTAERIQWAKDLIFGDLLVDFPLTDQSSKAHAVAVMVLPFLFPLINNVTPFHMADAPKAGTGKGLLLEACLFAAYGRNLSGLAACKDDDEYRKRISSKLATGANYIFIDNIPTGQIMDSGAVASYLTQRTPEERVLGQSAMLFLKNQAIWLGTGNNFTATDETLRRCLWMRLDANLEHPEYRNEFKHRNLLEWCASNRDELATAAIILCRAWVDNGMIPWRKAVKGNFERWSEVIGGVLDAVGIEGFLENQDKLYETASGNVSQFDEFIRAWWEKFGGKEVTVADVYPLAGWPEGSVNAQGELIRSGEYLGLLEGLLNSQNERGRKIQLDKMLNKRRDQVIAGYKLLKGGRLNKQQMWRLKL